MYRKICKGFVCFHKNGLRPKLIPWNLSKTMYLSLASGNKVSSRFFFSFIAVILLFFQPSFPVVTASDHSPESAIKSNPNNSTFERRDPTAKVDTKIHVSKKSVRIQLTEFTDDLIWIHGMESDDQGLFDKDTLSDYLEKHRNFLKKAVEVRDADGVLLKPTLVDEGDDPFEQVPDGQKLNESQLIRRKMSFTYEYTRNGKVIDLITIRHRIIDSNFLYPGEMSIGLYQGASDLEYGCKLRVDTPLTIPFDWENPFPNKDDSKEVIEKWLDEQAKKMLGVTEYGSVYYWGYVEQRRLRVELLVPLNVIDSMMEIPARDKNFLTDDELPEAEKRIKAFFSKGNPVKFDGEICKPQVQAVSFFPANQRDFAIRTKLHKISFVNGRVGITIFYPYRKVPQEILTTWDKYTHAVDRVEAYYFSGQSAYKKTLKRVLDDSDIRWKNSGEIVTPEPVKEISVLETDFHYAGPWTPWNITIGCVVIGILESLLLALAFKGRIMLAIGCGIVTGSLLYFAGHSKLLSPLVVKETRASQVTSSLLQNIYKSYDFANDEQQYETLQKSATGKQLTDLFLNLRAHIKVEEQGGAISNIEQVKILSANSSKPDPSQQKKHSGDDYSFFQQVEWELVGLVEHWGHSHERTNRYKAIMEISQVEKTWKIRSLKITGQDPGTVKPRPRKFKVQKAE